MIRKLKAILLVGMALSAMAAMASSASAATFTAAKGNVTVKLTPKSNMSWTVTGKTVTCSAVKFHGETAGTAFVEITIKPSFLNCVRSWDGGAAQVTGFGDYGETKTCDYVIYANESADLVCQAGAEVTIDAGTCSMHIPGQKGLQSIKYTNTGFGTYRADINFTNIVIKHTDGFLCPFAAGGETSEGEASIETEAEGSDPETEESIGLTFDS